MSIKTSFVHIIQIYDLNPFLKSILILMLLLINIPISAKNKIESVCCVQCKLINVLQLTTLRIA